MSRSVGSKAVCSKTVGGRARWVLGVLAAVISTLVLTGCGTTEPEKGVEDGVLKGSSWSRADKYSSSVGSWDLTYNLNFTSDQNATLTRTGWTESNTTTGGRQRNNVNETTNYTYVYAYTIREGYLERSNGSVTLFSISSDFKTLTMGSNAYNRK